ncbi:hypothetical protein PsorP6_012716 [Peronosclerospora sorghi]|uniref:Uncharacterized protein n=1 Tax=Peronosclerospora sorghi TaxID=230839 RepID=A0ACC0WGD4_9STRA|nr:hypothetical protein PsorP6_012716 [Peronosclerospora sorghi]
MIARFNSETPAIRVRLVAENPTGYVVRVQAYVEAAGHNERICTSIGEETHGELDGMPITIPYPVVFPFDKKREMAKVMSNMVYVYDFLELLEYNFLLRQWRKYVQQRTRVRGGSTITIPNLLMETRELILDATGKALTDFWWSFDWDLCVNNEGGRQHEAALSSQDKRDNQS